MGTILLEVTIQTQVLDLLLELIQQFGMAMLFITHDLGVICKVAYDLCVMQSGQIVEYGPVKKQSGPHLTNTHSACWQQYLVHKNFS